MEGIARKSSKIGLFIDFENGVIGKIVHRSKSEMKSTNSFLKDEWRCSLVCGEIDHYLTSFNTKKGAIDYLLHLHRNRVSG